MFTMVITAPTEQVEAADQRRQGLRHGDHDENEGLVGVLDQDLAGEAARMVGIVDEVEDEEEGEGEERAEIVAQPDAQVAHEIAAAFPVEMLRALATIFVSLMASPSSSLVMPPS